MEDAGWMVILALLALLGITMWFAGPCELFALGSVADMPARCL